MKVSLVLPAGVIGGAERWALGVLDEQPLDVTAVLLGQGPLESELRGRGVPTTVLDTSASPVAIARRGVSLARVLRRDRPDVVWANGIKAAAVALVAGRLTRVPVVWVKHDRSFDARLARPIGRAVARVVAVSQDIAGPVGRDDTVIIPPPLPDEPARPRAEARRALLDGWSDAPERVAATVGRLVPYKGVDTAIRALAEPRASDWGVLVIGQDDPAAPGERDRLRALAEHHGVADRVRFTGPVPEAGRLLAGADACLVLTGRDEAGFGGEGWSTVALEALWAGTPLIGSPEGAPMAARSGGVVPVDDPASVAERLSALSSPDAVERARVGGAEVLEGHPDRRQVAEALVALLSDVTRG